MLRIITDHHIYSWNMGQPHRPIVPSTITAIQADGLELDWVLSNVTVIPSSIAQVQNWFGNTARQVFASLPTSLETKRQVF